MFPQGEAEEPFRLWADSDWVGDVMSRRSCSGGYIQRAEEPFAIDVNTQANVALPSGRPS